MLYSKEMTSNVRAMSLLILFSVAGSFSSSARAEDTLPRVSLQIAESVTLTMEGQHQRLEGDRWSLSKGTWLSVTSPEKKLDESVLAVRDGVLVRCGEAGILEASGVFVLQIRLEDGTRYRVPQMYPSISRRFEPDVRVPLFYSKLVSEVPDAENWVTRSEAGFRTAGFGGAEAIYPPGPDGPMMLVSMCGETGQIRLSSDLRTNVQMDGKFFEFWKSARTGLKREKSIFAEVEVPPTRTGAEAYKKYIRKSMDAIDKIAKGYEMLRMNQHAEEVVRRLFEEGAPLPRLSLAEITIVRGNQAFSLRPFVNWRGKGRVSADSATLVNEKASPSHDPPFDFVLGELTGRIYTETRLAVKDDGASIETRRPGTEEWSLRDPDQFDLVSRVTFTPGEEVHGLVEEVDATGYFQRKDLNLPGMVRMGRMEASKDRLLFHYEPTSENREAAIQLSNFMAVRRNLFFPDRELRFGKLRPPGMEGKSGSEDFLNDALDGLVEAVDKENLDQIDVLDVEISNADDGTRSFRATAAESGGRTAGSEYRARLEGKSLVTQVYKALNRSRYATDWLDLDLGVDRF